MLILERVHLNALQIWIVGRLKVGITCEQQKMEEVVATLSKRKKNHSFTTKGTLKAQKDSRTRIRSVT